MQAAQGLPCAVFPWNIIFASCRFVYVQWRKNVEGVRYGTMGYMDCAGVNCHHDFSLYAKKGREVYDNKGTTAAA